MWYESTGVLHHGPGLRLVLEADQGIADYYRALAPKWLGLNRQRHSAHVTVVRREQPDLAAWGRRDGEVVVFEYCNEVEADETYAWLPVRCGRLEAIRVELGLPPFPWWRNQYHLTIGNFKKEVSWTT